MPSTAGSSSKSTPADRSDPSPPELSLLRKITGHHPARLDIPQPTTKAGVAPPGLFPSLPFLFRRDKYPIYNLTITPAE
jgi:hypothetical protein